MKTVTTTYVDLQQAFGLRIRRLRTEAGFSQEELANVSGLDRTYIGGIERGERNPSLRNIYRISSALAVPITAFFDARIITIAGNGQ
jgi:transcriptional regulator with XRE-family HTH domain